MLHGDYTIVSVLWHPGPFGENGAAIDLLEQPLA